MDSWSSSLFTYCLVYKRTGKSYDKTVYPIQSKIFALWPFTHSLPTPALRKDGQTCES